MKIGIIGLRPRQAADVLKRNLAHEIECYDFDRPYTHATMTAFSRNKDHIVVMQKIVPRHATDGVEPSKLHMVLGSVSAVIRHIEELPAPVEATETKATKSREKPPVYNAPKLEEFAFDPEPVVEPMVKVVEEAPKVVAPPARLIASNVPEGHRSQYLLPKSDILINYPNSGGVQNYGIMQAALVGDVVRFARPEGLSLANWMARIASMRSNHWLRHGMLLEAHFFNEYVDIQVMDQQATLQQLSHPAISPDMRLERILDKPQLNSRSDFPFNADGSLSKEFLFEQESFDLPLTDEVFEECIKTENAQTAEPVKASTATERVFWRQVFVSLVKQGNSVSDAGKGADEALRLHRERFAV